MNAVPHWSELVSNTTIRRRKGGTTPAPIGSYAVVNFTPITVRRIDGQAEINDLRERRLMCLDVAIRVFQAGIGTVRQLPPQSPGVDWFDWEERPGQDLRRQPIPAIRLFGSATSKRRQTAPIIGRSSACSVTLAVIFRHRHFAAAMLADPLNMSVGCTICRSAPNGMEYPSVRHIHGGEQRETA